jgi:hypothetical protein
VARKSTTAVNLIRGGEGEIKERKRERGVDK